MLWWHNILVSTFLCQSKTNNGIWQKLMQIVAYKLYGTASCYICAGYFLCLKIYFQNHAAGKALDCINSSDFNTVTNGGIQLLDAAKNFFVNVLKVNSEVKNVCNSRNIETSN